MTKFLNGIYLNISGFNVKIKFSKFIYNFMYERIKKEIYDYYKNFVINYQINKIHYEIIFSPNPYMEILKKRKNKKYFINLYEENNKYKIVTFYHISLNQFQVILNNIIDKLLADHEGFILHASASNRNGKALVFTGKPGAGKSTAMRLLNEKYPSLADDSIIIRKVDTKYYIYQVPNMEKEPWIKKSSKRYLLDSIFFLQKKNIFKINKINDKNHLIKSVLNQYWSYNIESSKYKLKYVLNFVNNFDRFYLISFALNKNKFINLIQENNR